jgi:hypothetical protein
MSATIRHSSLPKLAQCAKYESNPVAGPAAERGTRLDAAFRAFLMGEPVPVELSTEEQENVMWAVDTVRDLADGGEIEADEVNLKVNTPGLSHVGTEDARCENEAMSFDLKTGQSFRSYYEQVAAYALGNMERTFGEHWTCCLLFCDQREFTRIEFSYATAKAVVDGVLEAVNDPNAVATPCEYCSWCLKADSCAARTGPIVETLATVESQPTVSLEALKAGLLADPERLGAFLTTNAIFEDFVDDLKTKAKALMKTTAVPGWKLQEEAGREHFDRIAIVSAAVTGKSGLDDLVANCGGKMSGTKFREWCAKMGVPVQEKQAIVGKDIVKLVADKKKARKAK